MSFFRALTYRKASRGKSTTGLIKYVRPVLITLIVFFLLLEVILRISWKVVDEDSATYTAVITSYFLLILVTTSLIMFGFLYYGLRLYHNLVEFEEVNVLVKMKLQRVRLKLNLVSIAIHC